MVSACPFLSLLHPPGDGEIRTACGSSGVGTPAFHVNKITPSVLFTARVGMLSCWVALFYVLSALRWWFRSTVNHDSRTSFIVACSWTQPHLGTVSNTFPGCSISSSMSMAIFLLVFSVLWGLPRLLHHWMLFQAFHGLKEPSASAWRSQLRPEKSVKPYPFLGIL